MKGTPAVPQCGFSRAAVGVLDLHGVPKDRMKTFDVLEDQELRSGIKEFSCVLLHLESNGQAELIYNLRQRLADYTTDICRWTIYWGL